MAKWDEELITMTRYTCSECGDESEDTWNFCPNCGARMEGA